MRSLFGIRRFLAPSGVELVSIHEAGDERSCVGGEHAVTALATTPHEHPRTGTRELAVLADDLA